jgi:hypothetical protein
MKTKKARRTIYLTMFFVIASLGLSVGFASAQDIICNGEICTYPGGDYGYIIVKNDGKLTVNGDVNCKQVEVVKGTLTLYGGWKAEKFIVRNGTVYVTPYNSAITGTGTFFLQCEELLLEGGCVLSANGAGGETKGNGGSDSDAGGGGGYGGRGGSGYHSKASGGSTYGDYRSLDIEMGSQGGGSSYGSGGRGGGKIFIIAQKASVHGTITANGNNGEGGGSGGGIFIKCEEIDFTGSISANGGNGYIGDDGGGGGGRIKIIYDTGFAVELLSQIQAKGGTGYNNGANGTIWTDVRPAPPALVVPGDGARVGNPPTFRFTVLDLSHELDGRKYDTLSCKIELSQDNFETICKTFDQNISIEGWSELQYTSGNEAQFTPPEPLLEGCYQWRAYVYDVRLWSEPSEVHTVFVGKGTIPVESSAYSLYADGKSTATITATVTDSKGKPITDETVEMSVDGGGKISSPAKHEGDGKYTATYTAGTTPGTVTITAKATKLNAFGTVEIKLGCSPCDCDCPPCDCEDVSTNTLAVTGTVYRETGEVAENGLPVEVSITTQRLTEKDDTGKTAGDGQYSVTFFDMQKPVAKAGDEILVTVKDTQGKLEGQNRHTLTAAEVEAKETRIDVTPFKTYDVKPVTLTLRKGINVISVPVKEGLRMSDLVEHIGKDNVSMIIRYDYTQDKFISYLPTFPKDSPANVVVQPGEGYIVVMKTEKKVEFEEKLSDDETAAPLLMPLSLSSNGQSTSIFVVTGNVRQEETGRLLRRPFASLWASAHCNDIALNKVAVRIRNLRTGQTVRDVTGTLAGYGNYVATFVASEEEFMTRSGDKLEITAQDANHRLTIEPVIHTLTPDEISDCALIMPLHLSLPKQSALLQNYPNPFNPETWIPYQLARDANVNISIYSIKGQLIRTLHLGNQSAGIYVQKGKAAYWDGRDNEGERVASGVYFYTLQVREVIPRIGVGDFTATRKMVIVK